MGTTTRNSLRRIAALLGPIWAFGISAYILFAPMIRTSSTSRTLNHVGAPEQSAPIHSTSSWFKTYGLSALKPLLFPVVLSLLPLLGASVKSRRIIGVISVLSLGAFCVLAIFSIGSFYFPIVVTLFLALVLEINGNGTGITQQAGG